MKLSKKAAARKRAKAKEYHDSRKVVIQRCHGFCEARWDGCTKVANHTHHMKRRSQGGGNEPENLLAVCYSCHDKIHRNPAEAFAKGHLA